MKTFKQWLLYILLLSFALIALAIIDTKLRSSIPWYSDIPVGIWGVAFLALLVTTLLFLLRKKYQAVSQLIVGLVIACIVGSAAFVYMPDLDFLNGLIQEWFGYSVDVKEKLPWIVPAIIGGIIALFLVILLFKKTGAEAGVNTLLWIAITITAVYFLLQWSESEVLEAKYHRLLSAGAVQATPQKASASSETSSSSSTTTSWKYREELVNGGWGTRNVYGSPDIDSNGIYVKYRGNGGPAQLVGKFTSDSCGEGRWRYKNVKTNRHKGSIDFCVSSNGEIHGEMENDAGGTPVEFEVVQR